MSNNSNQWDDYNSRAPRTLRVELAAPYDQVVTSSGVDTFSKMDYKSNDNNSSFSMMPWEEPDKSPVIIQYGLSEPVFTLPPSSFVNIKLQAAHVAQITVKPIINPLLGDDALLLAATLIKLLDDSSLTKISGQTITLDEVLLAMKFLAKDMKTDSYEIGRWQRQELHGISDFLLTIDVIKDQSNDDPLLQLYSIELFIFDSDNKLEDKLENLMKIARTKVPLTKKGKPCTADSYDCEIADVRVYLDTLRKEKLIPIR